MAEFLTLLVMNLQTGTPAAEPVEAPLEFRCANMQVLTEPNRAICRQDVVIRRGDLLVCCQLFEGQADKAWGWQRFICTDEVRAQRGDETMWAEKAELVLETNDLILTGKPLLHRGKSILSGTRVIVDIKRDRARIEKPRGRIQAADENEAPPPSLLEGPLPEVCPIAPEPKG